MLVLLLILVLTFLALMVALWTGSLVLQGYVYSEPAEDLHWRAPAAAAAITLFVAAWALIDYAALDPSQADLPLDTLFRFSPTESRDVPEFKAIKNRGKDNEQTLVYKRQGPSQYLDAKGRPWQRADTEGIVEAIVVEDKGEKWSFVPRLQEVPNPQDPRGPKLKVFPPNTEAFPTYYQEKGRRTMVHVGQVSLFRWGMFLANLLFNFLYLGVWFVCLWLLLRYQWPHALGLAVILWLLTLLVVLPMILAKTQDVARQRAGMQSAAWVRRVA